MSLKIFGCVKVFRNESEFLVISKYVIELPELVVDVVLNTV